MAIAAYLSSFFNAAILLYIVESVVGECSADGRGSHIEKNVIKRGKRGFHLFAVDIGDVAVGKRLERERSLRNDSCLGNKICRFIRRFVNKIYRCLVLLKEFGDLIRMLVGEFLANDDAALNESSFARLLLPLIGKIERGDEGVVLC